MAGIRPFLLNTLLFTPIVPDIKSYTPCTQMRTLRISNRIIIYSPVVTLVFIENIFDRKRNQKFSVH
jgi:hypothetical protein